MTRITYFALLRTNKENPFDFPKYNKFWSEIVSGGEEELIKRKQEIIEEHNENKKFFNTTQDATFYPELEVKNYLDFEI